MRLFIYLFISFFFMASCYKENEPPTSKLDITGIYNTHFTGSYVINTFVYAWNLDQLMKISKVNDTLFSLCVYYRDSCISGTTTTLKVHNTSQIIGLFNYSDLYSLGWKSDTLWGGIDDSDKIRFKGIFKSVAVRKILVHSGPYTYPEYVSYPVKGTFLFTKSN